MCWPSPVPVKVIHSWDACSVSIEFMDCSLPLISQREFVRIVWA